MLIGLSVENLLIILIVIGTVGLGYGLYYLAKIHEQLSKILMRIYD